MLPVYSYKFKYSTSFLIKAIEGFNPVELKLDILYVTGKALDRCWFFVMWYIHISVSASFLYHFTWGGRKYQAIRQYHTMCSITCEDNQVLVWTSSLRVGSHASLQYRHDASVHFFVCYVQCTVKVVSGRAQLAYFLDIQDTFAYKCYTSSRSTPH